MNKERDNKVSSSLNPSKLILPNGSLKSIPNNLNTNLQIEIELELKKQKRLKTKMYYTNIQEDFSKAEFNEEERLEHSLRSANLFNQRLLKFRHETKDCIKKIEDNKLGSRFPIDSINSAIHSHQVPLTIQLDNGMTLHDNNDALNPSQNTVEKFIQ